jgi:hypothetical protein
MGNEAPKSLAELTREISLLIEYGAPDDEFTILNEVLEKYDSDLISLNVFHHFYSYLPEAKDDGIVKISKIANRQGTFLFCATTLLSDYLYMATREAAALIGPLENVLDDPELLEYFGWKDSDHFDRATRDLAEFPEHTPLNESHDLCPVCGTGDGELHAFGCPVEICPWCEGQLTNCECRFTKTGRDNFSHDSHLQELLDLLEAEGRIPFNAEEHRPSFMSEEE